MNEEVAFLKKVIPEKNISKKKMKELVIRSLYVEMLGQDASFAYIKVVELCASTNILQVNLYCFLHKAVTLATTSSYLQLKIYFNLMVYTPSEKSRLFSSIFMFFT